MKNFKILILGLVLSLGLCVKTKAQTFRYSNKPKNGPIMLVGGVTLITTSVIDNNSQGYWKHTYSAKTNSYTKQYVKPNILANTPVNIIFGVGVTLTVTGFFSSLMSIK